jgi:RNA polymerase sigma-70 factor (ECF subfamily)
MKRYCDGDRAAFRALYELFAPKLLRYLTSLARDRATAEDLLQQTFLKLHNAREVYVRGADPGPWMYTIAHRTFLDDVRRKRRSPERLWNTEEDSPATMPAEGDHDGRFGDFAEQAVLRAVERLPEIQRLAVVTTKLEGRSMAQAAAILGTTEGALKVRAHRAYATLRAALAPRVAV